jgi:hypothetical protein
MNSMPPPQPIRQWYHLTPVRFFIGLLAVQVFLLLFEQFQWFAFNEKKGGTVLIAVAVVCVAVVVTALWGLVCLCLRRRFQFSVRSLLLFLVAASLPLGWFAWEMQRARKQRKTVEQSVARATEQLFGGDASGKRVDSVEIIALSVKGITTDTPPHLSEEIIAVLKWAKDDPGTTLVYLQRSELRPHWTWHRRHSDDMIGCPWKVECPLDPTEAEIVRFVKMTAFGHNEYLEAIRVSRVVLYRNDMAMLSRHLADGIADAEKRRRRIACEIAESCWEYE